MDKDQELEIKVIALWKTGVGIVDIADELDIPQLRVKEILEDHRKIILTHKENTPLGNYIERVWPQVNKAAMKSSKSKGRKRSHEPKVIPASEIPRGYIW